MKTAHILLGFHSVLLRLLIPRPPCRAALGLALALLALPLNLFAGLLQVTPEMLSGNFLFQYGPFPSAFSSPIPYGYANNTGDSGWIWANESYLVVQFPNPIALTRLRAYVTFAGGTRGATWAIEVSQDGAAYDVVANFDLHSSWGGGLNDDGTARGDCAGWYGTSFNQDGAQSGRYWRVRQTGVTEGHAPRVGELQFHGVPLIQAVPLPVTASMISASSTFLTTTAGATPANPIPYGAGNNVNDLGWIWANDNSGYIEVDFGIPSVLNGFRAFVTYAGGSRGANWAIESSEDRSAWDFVADFPFVSTPGGGINDDYTPRDDFAGWYETVFNTNSPVAARYWRVRQTAVLVNHAPRCGQVEFYGFAPLPVRILSALPQGGGMKADTNLVIQLEDGSITQVDPLTVQLALDGQTVVPAFDKPAGGSITTLSYDPPAPLAQGPHTYQVVFGDNAVPPNLQTNQFNFVVVPDEICQITPDMLSGNFSFFVGPAFPSSFSLPIPYGFANNTNDVGWIWTNDSYLVIQFVAPTALARLRAFVSYPGGARGARWAIDVSNDGLAFDPVSEWVFESSPGGGLNEDGTRRADYAGWYETMFNQDGAKSGLFWRVRQIEPTLRHAPRVAELQFYTPPPLPSVLAFGPTGNTVLPGAAVTISLQDNLTPVDLGSLQFFFDGHPVDPNVDHSASSFLTTVSYDPPGDLSWGVHTVRLAFANLATTPVWQTNDWTFRVAIAPMKVCASMLSGSLNFMDAPPATTFAEPIPYGIPNNDTDYGWIWPTDNSGLLNVDFGLPAMVTGFRAYVTYGGGQRGANWAIEYSEDQATWTRATDFHFLTTLGGGLNDDFTHRSDYGGWYEVTFNPGATIAARFWRVRQTDVLADHPPRCGQVEFYGALLSPLPVTAAMLSGAAEFLTTNPDVAGFADPIPYGIPNNVSDLGWIWSREFPSVLQVDFGHPQVVSIFRAYSSYVGDGNSRGAIWAIERSDDALDWASVADFVYETQSGAGLSDDGCKRSDYAGWYGTAFNSDRVAARYWRVRQVQVSINHPPRTAQVQFFEIPASAPLKLYFAKDGNNLILSWTDPTDSAVLQWAEAVTGPWNDLPTASSPCSVNASEGAKFYRLRR